MEGFIKYKLDYLVIILLSFPILFLKLGSFSLRLWDESIYATNSIEMMERGEWIVPYFNGEMDYWNTKPPMINWLQIISMKIFGINEFAVRLPSALAALFTVLLVYWFLKNHFTRLAGMMGSLVLLTSVGFISYHGARTGDTDALLTLCTTAVSLFVLDALLKNKFSNKHIFAVFIFLVAGFLTKSIAAFLLLPPILFFVFYFHKNLFLGLLRNKIFWITGFSALILIFGFILLRNSLQPGYLDLIFSNEMGRMGTTIEQHQGPFFFYLDNLVNQRFSYWILLAMGSFSLFFLKEKTDKSNIVVKYVGAISLFYFLLISISVTKLAWYDLPLFPILAINIALLLHFIFEKLQLSISKSVIAVCIVFFIPYKHVFGLSQTNHYVEYEMKNEVKERYLKLNFDKLVNSDVNIITVYCNSYDRSLRFYKKRFELSGKQMEITNECEMKPNSLFIIENEFLSKTMSHFFNYNNLVVEHFENLHIIKSE